MDELQIATAKANLLNKLRTWGQHSTYDGSYDPRTLCGKLDDEELENIRIEVMTANLAMKRAKESGREYGRVLMEVEYTVGVELGRILAKTVEAAFVGTMAVEVKEGEEEVCGVCMEEIEGGDEAIGVIGCKHKFHGVCIVKWLKLKSSCPLCRFPMQVQGFEGKF